MTKAKILLLDIELAPNLAYVWQRWKVNIGMNQFEDRGFIMSFAAKWLGDTKIVYQENRKTDDSAIVRALYDLLDEADIVVAHNGKDFDLPHILTRGIVHGFPPPSPYHIVDTLKVARKEFLFLSNSLEDLCKDLKLPLKGKHGKFSGFELWWQCLRGNDEAWEELAEYNKQDVICLEALYLRLLPYIKNHPNVDFSDQDTLTCPKCGSTSVQKRGQYRSAAGVVYQRFKCQPCGGWGHAKSYTSGLGASGRSL